MKNLTARKLVNTLITFLNEYCGYRKDLSQRIPLVPLVPFESSNRMEFLVWRYALAVQDVYISALNGGHGTEEHRALIRRADKLKTAHSDELREYLKPYINEPKEMMVHTYDWHRWYASGSFR